MWYPWKNAAPIDVPFFIWWIFGVDCYDCGHRLRSLDEFMEHSFRHTRDQMRRLTARHFQLMVDRYGMSLEEAAMRAKVQHYKNEEALARHKLSMMEAGIL